jgi:hypothetical protein
VTLDGQICKVPEYAFLSLAFVQQHLPTSI